MDTEPGLHVEIKEMTKSVQRLGVVAVVIAEWHPTYFEDEYSSHTAPITQKVLDQIKKDAKTRSLNTGEPLVLAEQSMCRDFQQALVDNVVSELLAKKHEIARLEQVYGSEFD